MRGLFITATDTGAGKTFVAAMIARELRTQGQTVRACKPVATGADWVDGRWLSDDTRVLAEATGDEAYDEITPWSFPTPAAPPVAGRLEGIRLQVSELAAAVRRQWTPGAVLLVEGIGGLLCPLTDDETVADLAQELSLPMVIVARRSLGTLNHTLLTLEAASARGLRTAGVVVCETTPLTGPAEETNVEELRRRIRVPILAVVPHWQAGARWTPPAVDWAALADAV